METNGLRKSFSKLTQIIDFPDLLDIQLQSFKSFLQDEFKPEDRKPQGLQAVFENIFPIVDSRENFCLEFSEYYVEKPKYDIYECQERGVTFSVPLKAKLKLSIKDDYGDGKDFVDTIEQVMYLGNIPYMTHRGTFIINGAERIIVSQLHRSPGVFFDEQIHPNGTKLFSARIIPLRGSWVEFTTDINDVMFVYIDRRKKFPVTTLLRALGYSTDRDLLNLFDLVEEVKVKDRNIKKYIGRTSVADIIDTETGELILEKDGELTEEVLSEIKKIKIDTIKFLKPDGLVGPEVISNTLKGCVEIRRGSARDDLSTSAVRGSS